MYKCSTFAQKVELLDSCLDVSEWFEKYRMERVADKCAHQNKMESLFFVNCNKVMIDFPNTQNTMDILPDLPDIIARELKQPDKIIITIQNSQCETLIVIHSVPGDFVIGRNDHSNNVEIDLSPYGAFRLGVSRKHARLYLADDEVTWVIKDLGSKNGSYVNQQRLPNGVPHIIRHGDEITLGNMLVKVFFSYGAWAVDF